jgi:spore germination protein GerM
VTTRSTALVVVALTALAAACGVPTDNKPRAIPKQKVPAGVIDNVTDTTAPEGGTPVNVYLARSKSDGSLNLVAVQRHVPSATPATVLEALLAAVPTDREARQGTANLIPRATKLASPPELAGDMISVDLSEGIYTIQSENQLAAFGQIVCTADGLEHVNAVRFQVAGKALAVPAGDGATTKEPVSCRDYGRLRSRPNG